MCFDLVEMQGIKLYFGSIICALLSLIQACYNLVFLYDYFLFLLPHLLLWLIRILSNCVLPPSHLNEKSAFPCTSTLCLALRHNLVNSLLGVTTIMQTEAWNGLIVESCHCPEMMFLWIAVIIFALGPRKKHMWKKTWGQSALRSQVYLDPELEAVSQRSSTLMNQPPGMNKWSLFFKPLTLGWFVL